MPPLNPTVPYANAGLAASYAMVGNLERAYDYAKNALERGERDEFGVVPILKCMMEKGVKDGNDKRAHECRQKR